MAESDRSHSLCSNQVKWDELDANERLQYTNNIKAKSAVMLIQATHFVQSKNVDKAKQLLVQIADSCMLIKDPDEQVVKWIQISCSYLAFLHRSSHQKKSKSMHTIDKKCWHNRENFIVLKYNKFSGEFEPDDYEEGCVNQDVLQYVSKINMILFGCQNVENNHSLYVMFTSYWFPFTIAAVFLILAFIFLTSKDFFQITNSQHNLQMEIPSIIIGGLLVLPLLMIYMKQLEQKDNNFFEKKLGEQIKRINLDCQERNKKIQFMMPHGREINIKLGRADEEYEDDIIHDGVPETPEDEFMDKIKGLTNQMSKISGTSLTTFKY